MASPQGSALLSPSPYDERDVELTPPPQPTPSLSMLEKIAIGLRCFAIAALIPAIVLLALYGDRIRRMNPTSWPLEWIFATSSASSSILLLVVSLPPVPRIAILRYISTTLFFGLSLGSAILLLLPRLTSCPSLDVLPYNPIFTPSSPSARSHHAWTSRSPEVCVWNRVLVGLFFGSALLAFTILVSEVAFTIRLRREWNAQAQWERDEEERIRGIRLEVGSLGGSIGLSEMVERTMRDRGLSRADNRASYVSTNGRTVTSDDIAAYRAGYGDYQRDSRAQRTVSEVSPMDSGMDEPEDWTDDIGTGVRSWDEPVERYEVRRDNAGWGDESWGGAHIGADGRRGVGYAM